MYHARHRKIGLVFVVAAVVGCAIFAATSAMRKVRAVPTNYRVGKHPAFVNYEALPSLLNEELPLCHATIVADTCKAFNHGVAAGKVAPELVSSLLYTSPDSFKAFLDQIGLWVWFGKIDCQDLCEKTVASFAPGKLPTTSNTGCTSAASCGMPLAAEKKEIVATGSYLHGSSFEAPVNPPTVAAVPGSAPPGTLPDKGFEELQKAVVKNYKIFPVVELDIQPAAAAPTIMKREAVGSDVIVADLTTVESAVTKAVQLLETDDADHQKIFKRWFGVDDAVRRAEVKRILLGVTGRIDRRDISWVLEQSCSNENVYAYTYNPEMKDSSGNAMVFVCPLYVKQDTLVKLETIFHELTHLTDMSTADHAYGYKKNMNLGENCEKQGSGSGPCNEALDNADSFTYYLFDVNGDYKGENSIKDRMAAGFDDLKERANKAVDLCKKSKVECAKSGFRYAKQNPINTTIFSTTVLVVIILCICCCCCGGAAKMHKDRRDDNRY
jgi:hypothetical protein